MTIGDVAKTGASSDSDDDMFTVDKSRRPVSIYSKLSAEALSSDSESDDDLKLPLAVPLSRKKRGRARPAKRGRTGPSSATGAASGKKAPPKKPKKTKKTSVFEISSGDDDDDDEVEVQSVEPVEVAPLNDAAAQRLERARRALARANDSRIDQEAELQARRELQESPAEALRRQRQKEEAERARVQREQAAKAANAKPITLKVRATQGEIKVRIRTSDPVLKMLIPFCKKFGLDPALARLMNDGEDVTQEDTPETLELEDNMVLDVMMRKQR